MTDYMTIDRHILAQQHKVPAATGIFSGLLNDVALAAKIIAREMSRAGLNTILGTAGQTNTHGEVQQKLDVFADSVISSTCGRTGRLCVMASEEHEDILAIPTEFARGKYVLVYDPLDGSSNIDANVSTGTIFAIYRKVTSGEHGTLEDVLQAGDNLVGAGYVIYGPSTMLVYSAGQGVFRFTLEPTLGEFLLSHDNIRIPEPPRYYSVNQGNEKFWTPGITAYVKRLEGI